ncbi:MAG: 6-phosphofructokinase [Phycisphaerales bacterium]|nr:6-phosphofructokinase [Phycisphaerales bacterium]
MTTHPTRIGILTGGGDCPGLNAVLRAVVKEAVFHDIAVVGFEDGFLGLIEDRAKVLTADDVSGILTQGGTILGSSNKANPLRHPVGQREDGSWIYEDLTERCMQNLRRHGIEALVVIGGDGTMSCAKPFADRGINCIGVPKTIDNDLWGSDVTFGFSTAVETATEAIDRVRTTAASHHRVMIVEVMGRNAGWIALHSGIASGADVILIPEVPFILDEIAHVVRLRSKRGKRFSIVVASEGAKPLGGSQIVDRVVENSPDPIRLGGIGRWLSSEIEGRTGVESRYVVLGHIQRGGTPCAVDRVLATQFGDHAMHLLRQGARNRLVVVQQGELTDVDITEAAGRQRLVPLDHPLMAAARSVYTSFGDDPEL